MTTPRRSLWRLPLLASLLVIGCDKFTTEATIVNDTNQHYTVNKFMGDRSLDLPPFGRCTGTVYSMTSGGAGAHFELYDVSTGAVQELEYSPELCDKTGYVLHTSAGTKTSGIVAHPPYP